MQGFMGWTAERGKNGYWCAVKVVEQEPYGGAAGMVRQRRTLPLDKGASRKDAERMIRTLYVKRILQ